MQKKKNDLLTTYLQLMEGKKGLTHGCDTLILQMSFKDHVIQVDLKLKRSVFINAKQTKNQQVEIEFL